MFCLTTKKKFTVENPEVVVLQNGKFCYRVECPWEGKNGKKLTAFKFASRKAYERYLERSAKEPESSDKEPENSDEESEENATTTRDER